MMNMGVLLSELPTNKYIGFLIAPNGFVVDYHVFESQQHACWWFDGVKKFKGGVKVFMNRTEQDCSKWKYKRPVYAFPVYNAGDHQHPIDWLPPKRGRVRRITRGQKPGSKELQ